MTGQKKIFFCIDRDSYYAFHKKVNESFGNPTDIPVAKNDIYAYAITYEATEDFISKGELHIVTTSMAHFSFELLEQGYDIYLCYKDKQIPIKPHMDLTGVGEPCKDLRFGHNLLKLFRAGLFNQLLGIVKM